MERRTINNMGTGAADIVFNLAGWSGEEGQQSGWFRSLQGKLKRPGVLVQLLSSDRHCSGLLQRHAPSSENSRVTTNIANGPIELQSRNQSASIDGTSHSVATSTGTLFHSSCRSTSPLVDKDLVNIVANFPHDKWSMDGLTIATIVNRAGPFSFSKDVAKRLSLDQH